MAQAFLTPDVIAREAAIILTNKVQFVHMLKKQSTEFDKLEAKIGDTIRIKIPNRGIVSHGTAFSPNAFAQREVYLQLSDVNQTHMDYNFTSKDLSLRLDDFASQVLDPSLDSVGTDVESNAMAMLVPCINNIVQGSNSDSTSGPIAQGTINTSSYVPAAAQFLDFMIAASLLDNNLAPRNDRFVLINPSLQVPVANANLKNFNPRYEISGIYEDGYIGNGASAEWGISTLMPKYPIQPSGVMAAVAASQVTVVSVTNANIIPVTFAQVTQITLQFPTGSVGKVIKAGTAFKIAGIYKINPETRTTYSSQYSFAVAPYYLANPVAAITAPGVSGPAGSNNQIDMINVAADYTINSSNQVTLNLGYVLYDSTFGGQQNISAIPSASAVVNFWYGSEVQALDQAIMFHPDFANFASADLMLPEGDVRASRKSRKGISVRYLSQYVITNGDSTGTRLDTLWGAVMVRPELACRIIGATTAY